MGIACILTAVLHLALSDAGPLVTLQTLDGTLLEGKLQSWSNEQVLLATKEGLQTCPRRDLHSLRVANAGAADQDTELTSAVELIDGSRLPVREFYSTAQTATLKLAGSFPSQPRDLHVPIGQVRAVRLRPLAEAAHAQWRDIEDLQLPSDVLVLQTGQDGGLDHVEGMIGTVDSEHVEFSLDEEPISVKRSRLAGLRYLRPEQPATDSACVVHGHGDGWLFHAVRIEPHGKEVLIIAGGDVELQLPWNSVDWIDFSAGKIAYLSDLEPLRSEWTPLIEMPSAAQVARGFGEPRMNESFFGDPVTLRWSTPEGGAFRYNERIYRKGIAVRSRTDLIYRVPAGFRRFVADIGMDPRANALGHVDLLIEGDDRILFESMLSAQNAPLEVDLDVIHVRRLRFVIDYGENLDSGDLVNFGEARFLK